MFQYAFYVALKQQRPETKIDTSVFHHRPSHNGYELERLFDIHPEHATLSERNTLADVGKEWYAVLRRALGIKRSTIGQLVTEPDPADGWHPELLQSENAYLYGYWQTEKYFSAVADQIRNDFQFRLPLSTEDEALAQEVSACNSVSVHVRRGDYLKERRKADYYVCSNAYYRRAVECIQNHVSNPVFYVFSDEPEWSKGQALFPEGTRYISGHSGQKAYIDMQLMSLCTHHIIANSSFSWWGAWLGQHEGTLVLAPKPWFRFRARPDIKPSQWITIHAE